MANENKTVQKSIRLNEKVVVRIEEMAKQENRTFNNMVETLLLKHAGLRL